MPIPPRRSSSALRALGLVALAGCSDWRERVEPARAAAEPVQVAVAQAEPIALERKGYRVLLTPRAEYAITGYAAETSRKLLDRWDFVMPLDVALVWGPVADPAVLRHVRFHLSGRYASYRYDAALPAAAQVALPSHVANHHLVPASEDVAADLDRVRIGDLVTLRGKLVDVEIRGEGGQVEARLRTSLTRDDVGSGACEILWVESAEVSRD